MKENISSNVFRKRRDKDEENSSTNSFSIVEICNSKGSNKELPARRDMASSLVNFARSTLGREEMKGYRAVGLICVRYEKVQSAWRLRDAENRT